MGLLIPFGIPRRKRLPKYFRFSKKSVPLLNNLDNVIQYQKLIGLKMIALILSAKECFLPNTLFIWNVLIAKRIIFLNKKYIT